MIQKSIREILYIELLTASTNTEGPVIELIRPTGGLGKQPSQTYSLSWPYPIYQESRLRGNII